MLLAVDIGNTNIVAAVFEGDEITFRWRISSDARRTGDEYACLFRSLLRDGGVAQADIKEAAISSVVPALTQAVSFACRALCGKEPFVLSSATAYDATLIAHLDPASHHVGIGCDLLCNAVASQKLFAGSATIAVDFGTALTMIATDSSGVIRGVTISPGLRTAARSLSEGTAQLPQVALEVPPTSLGYDTESAIQAGIVLGYKGLVEGLIDRIKVDLASLTGDKRDEVKVAATGGMSRVLANIVSAFDVVDVDLTIRGLKLIFEAKCCHSPTQQY